jgi:stalled ribosome rescue protein Dom34
MNPTTPVHHVAVWIDHHEARIFRVSDDSFEESSIHGAGRRIEHRANELGESEQAKRFFGEVAGALGAADEILLVGPSTAKLHFLTYLQSHATKVAARVMGVETVDHPTDPQIAAHARRYFRAAERMAGKTPGSFPAPATGHGSP